MTRSLSTLALAAVAIGAAGLLAAPPAHADLISIGLGVNGGAITTEASGAGTASLASIAFDGYSAVSVTGTGNPPLVGGSLEDSNTLDVASSGTTNVLDVYVTESGITSPTGLNGFISSFTENALTAGWTVTESTYLDSADGIYTTTGTQLGSQTFNNIGVDVDDMNGDAGAGPYSVTELYVITTDDLTGSANSTVDLSDVAVPEPATLALFAAGLLGCAIGLRLRKRRGLSST